MDMQMANALAEARARLQEETEARVDLARQGYMEEAKRRADARKNTVCVVTPSDKRDIERQEAHSGMRKTPRDTRDTHG